MKEIEKPFGKLTVNENKFMNCGINHERDSSGSISTDQNEYILSATNTSNRPTNAHQHYRRCTGAF